MRYYAQWGGSPPAVFTAMVQRPGEVLARLFDAGALKSLVRVFLPLGLALPLLAADVVLPVVPSAALTMLSSSDRMHRLEDWYLAPFLPFLAGALAIAAIRLPRPDARRYVWSLLFSALAGFLLFSHAPLGRSFDADRYRLNVHQRLAAEVVEAVPSSAAVLAQDAFLTHLALRDHVYLFPWVRLMKDGNVLAQHDMQPSKGARPTSWWEPGWHFRDVYYLSLPPGTAVGRATLAVTLYDTYTQEPVAFENGDVVLPLLPIEIDGG